MFYFSIFLFLTNLNRIKQNFIKLFKIKMVCFHLFSVTLKKEIYLNICKELGYYIIISGLEVYLISIANSQRQKIMNNVINKFMVYFT